MDMYNLLHTLPMSFVFLLLNAAWLCVHLYNMWNQLALSRYRSWNGTSQTWGICRFCAVRCWHHHSFETVPCRDNASISCVYGSIYQIISWFCRKVKSFCVFFWIWKNVFFVCWLVPVCAIFTNYSLITFAVVKCQSFQMKSWMRWRSLKISCITANYRERWRIN